MFERIPEESLVVARLRLKRRVAACIVTAMAETGTSVEQIEHRLGRSPGYVWRYLRNLISENGSGGRLDALSEIMFAMGCEIKMSITRTIEAPDEGTPND